MTTTSDVSAEVVNVTPALAARLRESCHFERQRAIDPRNVDRLRLEMEEGRFVRGTPVFMCVLPDNSMRLVNGNHTLEAIKASGVTIPITFIYSRVPNLDAAAEIYATYDLHKVRSWADALKAVGMHEDLALANYVTPAVGFIMGGFAESPRNVRATSSRGARFETLAEYKAAAEILAASLHGAPKTHRRLIMRKAVLACALATARYQPSLAHEFWRGMAMDDGLTARDPRKALLRYLINNPTPGTRGRRLHALATASAWNAYFESREIEYVKPQQMSGFKLLGTPWGSRSDKTSDRQAVTPAGAADRPTLFRTGQQTSPNGLASVMQFVG